MPFKLKYLKKYLRQILCKRLHNKNVVFNSKKEQVNVKGVTFAYGKLKR